MSVLSDDPARKEAWLNEPYHSPSFKISLATGVPYRWHLDDLITRAIHEVGNCGIYGGVEFQLFNRWEAEYIQEQMAKRCPQIQYRMRWHFGGPLKDDGNAEKVRAGHDSSDLQV